MKKPTRPRDTRDRRDTRQPNERAQIRRGLLRSFAEKPIAEAEDKAMRQCFRESLNLPDFVTAFESWEKAMWRWVDSKLAPKLETVWRANLFAKRNRFSSSRDDSTPATERELDEYLQLYLLKRAIFLEGLRFKKDQDAEWFKSFAFPFYLAETIGDDAPFQELARLTSRRTSQYQEGKMPVCYWLLLRWIPSCYWAFSTEVVRGRLWRRGKSEAVDYNARTIKNVISKLKLVRPPRPPWHGVDIKGCPILPARSVTKLATDE